MSGTRGTLATASGHTHIEGSQAVFQSCSASAFVVSAVAAAAGCCWLLLLLLLPQSQGSQLQVGTALALFPTCVQGLM